MPSMEHRGLLWAARDKRINRGWILTANARSRSWLDSSITFDGDVLRRWFFNRWKALNLSFPICYFLLHFDLRKVPKHWFWIDAIDFQNSMKIAKSWILDAFLLVKSAFLRFSWNFGNRRSRFENSTKITKFNQNSTKNSKLESWDSGLSIGWRISVRGHHHQKLWRFRNSTKFFKLIEYS